MKDIKLIGFAENVEIVKRIDDSASKLGLDRSNYLRMIIREKLGQDSK
jgi:hypothetical protein